MRSKKKGYFLDKALSKTNHKIWSRRSVITNKFINKTLEVHNGKQFVSIKITPDMIGHKLGEFAFTRKIYQYKKGKKK